jgi:arylsulfatase
MEAVDRKFLNPTADFIHCANRDKKPFFRLVQHQPHAHLDAPHPGRPSARPGLGSIPTGMVEHDGQIVELLKQLDDLKIADNTVVLYTTDNGAEFMSWPDGDAGPRREEHQLGRRLSDARACVGPASEAGHRDQRRFLGGRLDADPAGGGRRT